MNVNRAQEILKAKEKIDVQLNGSAVWIDSIDSSQEMAEIHFEQHPSDSRIVPVSQLQEMGSQI